MAKRKTECEFRAYQIDAATTAVKAMRKGHRQLIVMPTGAGKTRTARCVVEMGKYNKIYAISPGITIKSQIEKEIPNCTSCTVHEFLEANDRSGRKRAMAKDADVLFVDEAHHITAPEWRGVLNEFTNAHIFGVTATPRRHRSGTGLGDIFDSLWQISYPEVRDLGFLVPIRLWYPDGYSRERIIREHKVPWGVPHYIELAKRKGSRYWKPGIHFEPNVAQCREVLNAYTNAGLGIRAAMITGNTSPTDRERITELYESGNLDILISPWALAEGFDAKRAEICVGRRSCAEESTYLQISGRIARIYGEKEIKEVVKKYGDKTHKAALFPKKEGLLIDDTCASDDHGNPSDYRRWDLDGNCIVKKEIPEDQKWRFDRGVHKPFVSVLVSISQVDKDFQTELNHLRKIAKTKCKSTEEQDYFCDRRLAAKRSLTEPRRWSTNKRQTCSYCRHYIDAGIDHYWEDQWENENKLKKPISYHKDCWRKHVVELDTQRING